MKASHDSLGHRGFYATKTLINEDFGGQKWKRTSVGIARLVIFVKKAEITCQDSTDCHPYPFYFSSIACRHYAYVT
jgi:hypothetical protein